MIDAHGYPTEDTLERIKKFDFQKDDPFEFADYICENWINGSFRWRFRNHDEGCLELHTLGWSGCESIVSALEELAGPFPTFWQLFWYRSQVGGHYMFRIRRVRK